jgi:uncharacterized protein
MKPVGDVYLFARAPRIGAAKRRLAADIGDLAAWRFYRETTRIVLRRIAADPRWRTWLSVTPDRYARTGRFWPAGVARAPQGPGDLGQRMARALNRIPNRPAIIVGSDVPALSADHIAAAFDALGRHDVVFGPAADGGYWLVGARTPANLGRLFRNVRWSSRHALDDTLAGLNPVRRVAFLETLDDVDDGAGLARMERRTT